MALASPDPGALGAIASFLGVVTAVVVAFATARQTWMRQTIRELKDLTEAQERQLDFQEKQVKLQETQLSTVQSRVIAIEQDNLSLVRRLRELDERNQNLEQQVRTVESRRPPRGDR